jgi:hypothetical protein
MGGGDVSIEKEVTCADGPNFEVGPSARWTAEGSCPHIGLSLHELVLFRWEDDFGVE